MIKEAYCSFEVAKLLKEKGFNEPCSSTYDTAVSGGKPIFYKYDVLQFFPDGMKNSDDKYGMVISAPTLQMAMKWLREVHKVNIEIHYNRFGENYKYLIIYKPEVLDDIRSLGVFYYYEDAVEAALKYSLENLI